MMAVALFFAKVRIIAGDIPNFRPNSSCRRFLGDVVIQRGTYHRWLKVADGKAVKMLVCLVDGGKFLPTDHTDTNQQPSSRYLGEVWLLKTKFSRNRERYLKEVYRKFSVLQSADHLTFDARTQPL